MSRVYGYCAFLQCPSLSVMNQPTVHMGVHVVVNMDGNVGAYSVDLLVEERKIVIISPSLSISKVHRIG